MIANARMYSLNAATMSAWRTLLALVLARAGVPGEVFDFPAPQSLPALWGRADLGAVFMCGFPLSRMVPRPIVLAAPVPNAPGFDHQPVYWTDMIVRADAPFERLEDTFGHRIAYTTPDSQSGYQAPRRLLAPFARQRHPLFAAAVGPLVTPRRVIEAILAGDADVGPLDSYAHALLCATEPATTARLRVVATTPRTPIPPLVASAGAASDTVARLRDALDQVARAPALAAIRDVLALHRFALVEARDYDVLQQQAAEVDAMGYRQLA
jgi:ABC-type phosphate/phosphonate transport system substrate-binding protein